MSLLRLAVLCGFATCVALGQIAYLPADIWDLDRSGLANGSLSGSMSASYPGGASSKGDVSIRLPQKAPGGTFNPATNILTFSEPLLARITFDGTFQYPAQNGIYGLTGAFSVNSLQNVHCSSSITPIRIENPKTAGSVPIKLDFLCPILSVQTGNENNGILGRISFEFRLRTNVEAYKGFSIFCNWTLAPTPDSLTLETVDPAAGTPFGEHTAAGFSARARVAVGSTNEADLFLAVLNDRGAVVAQTSGITKSRGSTSTENLRIPARKFEPGEYSLVAILAEKGTAKVIKESARMPYTVHKFRLELGTTTGGGTFVKGLPSLDPVEFRARDRESIYARVDTSLPADMLIQVEDRPVTLTGRPGQPILSAWPFKVSDLASGVPLQALGTDGLDFANVFATARILGPGGTIVVLTSDETRVEFEGLRIRQLIPSPNSRLPRGDFPINLDIDSKLIKDGSRLYLAVDSDDQVIDLGEIAAGRATKQVSSLVPYTPLRAVGSGTFSLTLFLADSYDPTKKAQTIYRSARLVSEFSFQDPLEPTLTGLGAFGVVVDVLSSAVVGKNPSVSRKRAIPPALFQSSPILVSSGNSAKGPRAALAEQDAAQILPVAYSWEFVPELKPDQLTGRMTLEYGGVSLPTDPNFDESKMELISIEESGAVTRWPTAVDVEKKTVSADIRGLARDWVLGVYGPFRNLTLAGPAWPRAAWNPRSLLLHLGTESGDASGLPVPQVVTEIDAAPSSGTYPARTVTGVTVMRGDRGGLATLAASEPVAGPQLAPLVRSTTEIHVASGPGPTQSVLFVLHDSSGVEFGRTYQSIDGGRRRAWRVDDLFDTVPADFTGYLWVTPGDRISAALTDFSETSLSVLPLVRPITARVIQSVTMAAPTSWLTLVNTHSSSDVRALLRLRKADGADLITPVTKLLAPGAQLRDSLAGLFGPAAAAGTLTIESSEPVLLGVLENFQGGFATAIPLEAERRFAVIPWFSATARESTLAIHNPGSEAAQVEVVVRQDAATVTTRRVTIAGGGTLTVEVDSWVPATGPKGNYVLINGSAPVAAQMHIRGASGTAVVAAQAPGDGVTIPDAIAPPPPVAPRVTVSPSALDFGTIAVAAAKELSVTLSNQGTGESVLTGISSSNPRFAAVNVTFPLRIAAGGQQAVTVRFTPVAPQAESGRLTLAGNDAEAPAIAVSGAGSAAPAAAPRLVPVPLALDFGSVAIGASQERAIVLSNTGEGEGVVSAVTSSNSRFTIVSPALPLRIPAGGRQTITVRFTPVTAQPESGRLSLTSNDALAPAVPVSGQGTAIPVAAPVLAGPETVDLGAVAVGLASTSALTLRNTGTAPLAITLLAISGAAFSLVNPPAAPISIAAGGQLVLTVRLAPVAAGAQTGELRITSNDPGRAIATVRLTGTATATVPNPAPLVETFVPATVTAGGEPFTLTVSGQRFVNGAEILLGGSALPTTFVNSTQLRATVTAAQIAVAGSPEVSVSNPQPGGGRSSAKPLLVAESGVSALAHQFDLQGCPAVTTFVSALDRQGNAITNLGSQNFKCTEDGVPVTCRAETAASAEIPLSVAVVVDTSAAAATTLDDVKRQVSAMFGRLAANDKMGVVQSDGSATIVAAFTSSRPSIASVVDGLRNAAPGSALLDAVDQAIRMVSAQPGRRQAVVVFAGSETSSGAIRDAAVLQATARSFGIPVFVLGVNSTPAGPWPQVSLDTTGRYLAVASNLQLAAERIAVQLEAQHVITWTASTGAAPKLFGLTFTGSQGVAGFSRFVAGCR